LRNGRRRQRQNRPISNVVSMMDMTGELMCVAKAICRKTLMPKFVSEVRGACEMLGLDPLYVANEGKLIVIVDGEDAQRIAERMRANPLGKESAIIGEVTSDPPDIVLMKTKIGGLRVVDMLTGEQLPRIC
jgi:AIR synthase related protein